MVNTYKQKFATLVTDLSSIESANILKEKQKI